MAGAHRVAYELLIGPIPAGLELDHLCRNRLCVNPAHLEPVTRQTNQHRGASVSGISVRATHCPEGHPYDADNTYVRPNGHRVCRECARRRQRPQYTTRQHAYVPKPRRD